MDGSDAICIVVLVILLCLSALFSSMETAFISCSKVRMRALWEEEENRKAKRVLDILDKQGKMLTAILICNNVVNLSASALTSVVVEKYFQNLGVTIATAVLTLLILIFGEISPKTYATIYADRLALRMSGLLRFLMAVMTPFIFVIGKLSNGFLRILGVDPNRKDSSMTEKELRVIVDVSHEEGVIEKEESEMIKNVVDFGDSRAKDIMIPRTGMTFVNVNMTYDELIEVFRQDMFTRMPVYEETTDEVIGIINMKDVLLQRPGADFSIRHCLREAYFTIESKHTSELLNEMREQGQPLAIVLDEYGATSGMITMEDLLEEIVGEIRDEYDADEKDQVRETAEDEYLIDASMRLSDINDWLGTRLESEDYDSLGGLIIEKLDHIPEEGEQVRMDDLLLTVTRVDGNHMEEIRLKFLPEEEKKADGDEKDKN